MAENHVERSGGPRWIQVGDASVSGAAAGAVLGSAAGGVGAAVGAGIGAALGAFLAVNLRRSNLPPERLPGK